MGDAPAVSCAGVHVRRGSREVLHGVECVLPAGSLVGLIGPSGCGKTTLMRCMVGLQAHVRGTVQVLGRPPSDTVRSGRVGYMSQDPAVYDDLSVRENLEYFAALLGVPHARIDAVLDRVRLTSFAAAVVARLSGGQRARASLAIALLADPRLLVLDEPTVGLDPVLRQELWADFRAMTTAGSTIVVSSHVMDEAERCDLLVLLRDGRVLATGSPQQLRDTTGKHSVEAAFVELVERGGVT